MRDYSRKFSIGLVGYLVGLKVLDLEKNDSKHLLIIFLFFIYEFKEVFC